jgi:F-type H+-transporting ATPase subunit b
MLYLSLLAAEAGGAAAEGATSKNPIVPELNELVYSLIAFVVLIVLFKKFAFKPIQEGLEARTKRIRDDLDTAESAKTQAESVLADYKKQLADAKAESDKIIDEARKQAEKVKDDVIAKANDEAAEIKAKASADIEAARASALASLQTSVAEIAIELAEKVVEKNLDRETNKRLIESFIAQVGS